MTKQELIKFCEEQLKISEPRYKLLLADHERACNRASNYDGGNPAKHSSAYWLKYTNLSAFKFYSSNRKYFKDLITELKQYQ